MNLDDDMCCKVTTLCLYLFLYFTMLCTVKQILNSVCILLTNLWSIIQNKDNIVDHTELSPGFVFQQSTIFVLVLLKKFDLILNDLSSGQCFYRGII